MHADRRGSITVTALLGTGAATLGLAFAGMAGLSNDLRAAARETAPPATTPEPAFVQSDVREMLREERLSRKLLQAECQQRRKAREQTTGTVSPREL